MNLLQCCVCVCVCCTSLGISRNFAYIRRLSENPVQKEFVHIHTSICMMKGGREEKSIFFSECLRVCVLVDALPMCALGAETLSLRDKRLL